jgi:hypothetical protein
MGNPNSGVGESQNHIEWGMAWVGNGNFGIKGKREAVSWEG